MKINKLLAGLSLGVSVLVPDLATASDLESSIWSETAASNTAATPNGFPDNIAPSSVKSIVREIMGAIKRDWNRSHTTVASTGSTNAYVVTYTTAPAAYVNGQQFAFNANFANTGSASANINGLGAKTIQKQTSSGLANLASGDIQSGQHVILEYDSAIGVLILLNPQATSLGANSVTNSQLAQMAANTIKGNNTGGTANTADLTVAQTVTMLGVVKSVTRQVFTASGTYTPHTGLLYAFIQVQAPGGGSGGAAATTGTTVANATGSGGGEYAEGVFTAAQIGPSQAATIGAAGAAGTAGANAGGNGGTSSVGSLISAIGGNGGPGATATATSAPQLVGPGATGGTGGTGGDRRQQGGDGFFGGWVGNGNAFSGPGGSSFMAGNAAAANNNAIGNTGRNYGGGASGSVNTVSQAAKAGAPGGASIIVITEYNSQ
jgi:hypothetical protein